MSPGPEPWYKRAWYFVTHLTNATKAHIVLVINGVIALLQSFGVIFTSVQLGVITLVVNLLLGGYVATTYKLSPKRIP